MRAPRAPGRRYPEACCARLPSSRNDEAVTRSYFAADTSQPVSVAVRDALRSAMTTAWASPVARSYEARSSALVLEAASRSLAVSSGAPEATVIITPGAAPALDMAVRGAGVADLTAVVGRADRQVVLAAARHRCQALSHRPATVPPLVSVDADARLSIPELRSLLATGDVGVVCTQVGNPEIGTCPDHVAIAHEARAAGAIVVLDATMSAGRCPLPDPTLWDVVVLWSNSWAGGPDVGVVVVRPGVHFRPATATLPAWATPRPSAGTWVPWGSPSVPLIAAAALGLEQALATRDGREARDRAVLGRLEEAVATVPGTVVYGSEPRLPHVLGMSTVYVDAEALTTELDTRGVAVSSGSACATDSGHSHVLEAIGGLTSGNVRITLPLEYDEADVERVEQALPAALRATRASVGL